MKCLELIVKNHFLVDLFMEGIPKKNIGVCFRFTLVTSFLSEGNKKVKGFRKLIIADKWERMFLKSVVMNLKSLTKIFFKEFLTTIFFLEPSFSKAFYKVFDD